VARAKHARWLARAKHPLDNSRQKSPDLNTKNCEDFCKSNKRSKLVNKLVKHFIFDMRQRKLNNIHSSDSFAELKRTIFAASFV